MASGSASAASFATNSNTGTPRTHASDNDAEQVDEEYLDPPPDEPAFTMIPDLFTTPPPIYDGDGSRATLTSEAQEATMEECLPFLRGEAALFEDSGSAKGPTTTATAGSGYNRHGVPRLDRERHARFLRKMVGPLPGAFVTADAARPWMLYWALSGLAVLGEDVGATAAGLSGSPGAATAASADGALARGLIATARSMQNADTGGFGGGHGQLSHLATSYAAVLALATLGGADAYDVVDRSAMARWLGQLKMPDGGFRMSVGGEEGVRFVVHLDLHLPIRTLPTVPELVPGVVEIVCRAL